MKQFRDKVAVVTGGASGIGKAIVRALLAEGAKVVVADVEQSAIDSACLLYTSPSPRDRTRSRMPSSA